MIGFGLIASVAWGVARAGFVVCLVLAAVALGEGLRQAGRQRRSG